MDSRLASNHTILVTGGAGFIGSNFVLDWIRKEPGDVINLDKLTYAGNLGNLASLENEPRHIFVRGDICDPELVLSLLKRHKPRAVVHFAAESHVDRSINDPGEFVRTNVNGTLNLLQQSRAYWDESRPAEEKQSFRFLHVSTDEVYGTLGADDPAFTEETPVCAQQPLRRLEGGFGPPGSRLAPHLRISDPDDQLLQQLRAVPVSREADSAGAVEGAGRRTAPGLWRWPEYPRLALRARPLRGHSHRAGRPASRARPTTSAAATSARTSMS